MYEYYMDKADPTEYSVALGLLGSWAHWETLCERDWFQPIIESWRKELKQKMAFERFKEMHAAASKGDLRGTKWLDDKYGIKPKSKRGRPSNAEKKRLLEEEKDHNRLLKEEAERMGLDL